MQVRQTRNSEKRWPWNEYVCLPSCMTIWHESKGILFSSDASNWPFAPKLGSLLLARAFFIDSKITTLKTARKQHFVFGYRKQLSSVYIRFSFDVYCKDKRQICACIPHNCDQMQHSYMGKSSLSCPRFPCCTQAQISSTTET